MALYEGDTVMLKCGNISSPHWFMEQRSVTSNIASRNNTYFLYNVTLFDSALYYCSEGNQSSSTTSLRVYFQVLVGGKNG